MLNIPSIFTDEVHQNNAQIRWCFDRCRVCHSIFTVTILKDDVPLATKCLMDEKKHGPTLYIWTKQELKSKSYIPQV